MPFSFLIPYPAKSRIPNFCHLYPESRIPCQDFGESGSQIPYPVKKFCVFQNPALYFGSNTGSRKYPSTPSAVPSSAREGEGRVSFPPFSRVPRASQAPEIPFPSLSNTLVLLFIQNISPFLIGSNPPAKTS